MKFHLLALLSPLLISSHAFGQTSETAFTIPAKELDFTGVKHTKQAKRVLLPSVYLEVMNWGKITSVTQTSALQTLGGAANSSARSTMEVAVPADTAMLRAVADELYTDLAAKLKAKGWEVVTYADVKDHPVLTGVKKEPIEPKLGLPMRKVSLGKQKMHYTIATPEGMPVIDPGMTIPLFNIRALLKERDVMGLETTYRFDPVALTAKGRHGIGSNSASTEAQANLVLAHAQATFSTPKGMPGWVRLKKPLAVERGIGDIKKAADVSPRFANGLSAALSLIGGGAISSKKGLYVCELETDALKASLLSAGKAFNDEIAKNLEPGE